MPQSNLERLIALAEEVFAVKNDPEQLDVDQRVIERLKEIHPASVSEENYGEGPVAWVLVIPTTAALMKEFLECRISEKELFENTPPNIKYEAVYLCSALVLKEYRRKGITKRLVINAIEKIMMDHPITSLFVWPFSEGGSLGAESIARKTSIPLFKRKSQ